MSANSPAATGWQRMSPYIGHPNWRLVLQWGKADKDGLIVFPLSFSQKPFNVEAKSNGEDAMHVDCVGANRAAPFARWIAIGIVE